MKPILTSLFLIGTLLLAPASSRAADMIKELDGHLVQYKDGKVVKVPKGSLKDKKIFAFYYSAHWCPPCRAFTPSLAEEYAELSKQYPQFELVFVSSDQDEKAMEEYMAWGKMNYPAIEYKDISKMKDIRALASDGIPYMVVVDADGKELAGKGSQDWVHPSAILPQLKKILKDG